MHWGQQAVAPAVVLYIFWPTVQVGRPVVLQALRALESHSLHVAQQVASF